MKLSSLLHPNLIKLKQRVNSQNEVIRELVEEICQDFTIEFKEKCLKLIEEREKLGHTVGKGISIPHARIEGFTDLIIGISLLENPVLVGEEEVRIIFLILTSQDSAPLYLNTLAAIARLAKNDELREKLLLSKKPHDVIKVIQEAGITVKSELTVRDIMEESFPVISPGSTIKEAIDLLLSSETFFALVVEGDCLCGELKLLDIVEKGIPDYIKKMVNLRFLRTLEPLEELLRKEDRIQVREVMFFSDVVVTPESSIVEAVVKMVKEKRFFYPCGRG